MTVLIMRRMVFSACVAAAFLAPSLVAAQVPADSFFDIFTEIEAENPQCDPCKILEMKIAALEVQITDYNAEIAGLEAGLDLLNDVAPELNKAIDDLQKQIDEMSNPKNFVESEGRRYDSSDHAAMQRRNANLWKAYKGGRMTAQEYSDEIGKPFDDPEVAEDLKILKEIIKDELSDRMKGLRKTQKEVKEQQELTEQKLEDLRAELQALEDALKTLQEQLRDCRDRCTEEPIDLPKDYGFGQDERGWFDGIFDWVGGLFGDDPPTIILPDPFDEPKDDGGPSFEDFQREMKKVLDDLEGGESADGSVEVPYDQTLPPRVCHLCDPLRFEVWQAQDELAAMQRKLAELKAEQETVRQIRNGVQDLLIEARRALEAFDKPSASAESEGRRMDSADQAAMRVRNARLWGEYTSGARTAQELENEWKKPFDDPAVKEELDAIKKQIRQELADAVEAAEKTLERLNAEFSGLSDRIGEIGESIAIREALLNFLLAKLEDCEKQCTEFDDSEDPEDAEQDFDMLIFPDVPKVGGEPVEPQDDGFMCGTFGLMCPKPAEEVGEVVTGPKECDAPAIPMSRCTATCGTTCTPSGVRIAIDGNIVTIEECGICPPPKIDLCPTGTYFEKAQCETDLKCECAEKAKSSDGNACFACKETEKQEADDGFMCGWFGLFCPDDVQVVVTTPDEPVDTGSSASSEEAETCDPPTQALPDCKDACSDGTCIQKYETFRGLSCFTCEPKRNLLCERGTEPEADCKRDCFSECKRSYTRPDGVSCFDCVSPPKSSSSSEETVTRPPALQCDDSMERAACEKSCDGTCLAAYIRNDGISCYTCIADKDNPCPIGTTPDRLGCEKICAPEGGSCKAVNNVCYSCVLPEPPVTDRASAPKVVSTTPGNGATDVPVDVRASITFSAPMLRTSLQSAISASFRYEFVLSADGKTVSLLLTNNLEYDKAYEFRVTSSATDVNGKALEQSTVVKFRTQKKPKETTAQPPPPPPPPTETTPPPSTVKSSSSSAKPRVQVLILSGKKYPVTQFIAEGHDDCPNHYHAANGFDATSLDGNHLPDPGGCVGYGRVPDVQVQTCATDGTECQ